MHFALATTVYGANSFLPIKRILRIKFEMREKAEIFHRRYFLYCMPKPKPTCLHMKPHELFMVAYCPHKKRQHLPDAQDAQSSCSCAGPIYPLPALFTCCLIAMQKNIILSL